MAKVYNTQSVANYNASPPADDGTEVSGNEVKWSNTKTKIGDPLKTAIEAIDAELVDSWEDVVVTVDTVSELKALAVGAIPSNQVLVRGHTTVGDGGDGRFRYSTTSTATDDNGTIFEPNSSPATGRWLRQYAGTLKTAFFGTVGDGSADDSSAFTEAQTALNNNSGGKSVVPYKGAGYVVGDNAAADTGVEPTTNKMTWEGNHQLLIHRAKNSLGEPHMFQITDVDDITIKGFEIDGESTAAKSAVALAGVLNRIVIKDLYLRDLLNEAIQYADIDTSAGSAVFDDIWLENIVIDGDMQETDNGSGINFFPRAQSGSDPVCKNLHIIGCSVDVTQGNNAESNHGFRCYKISNTDGVFIDRCIARGADQAAIIITNGCRNVFISNCHAQKANRGLQIDDQNAIATTKTQDVTVTNFVYSRDGLTGGEEHAIAISGSPVRVTISNANIDGNLQIISEASGDTPVDLKISNMTIWTSSGSAASHRFALEDAGAVGDNVVGALVDNLTVIAGASIQVLLTTGSREFDHSIFRGLYSRDAPATFIQNAGKSNQFYNVTMQDGDPGDTGSGPSLLLDSGDDTLLDGAALVGTHNIDFFVRKTGGDGLTVKNLIGTPADVQGFDFTNQESSSVPQGDVIIASTLIDLSGSATDETVYLAQDDTYILGISFLYKEASSADTGVELRIRKNDSSTVLPYTSEVSKAAGTIVNYINTSGTRSFATRKYAAGDFLNIECDGGKTGTGTIMVVVSAVRAKPA